LALWQHLARCLAIFSLCMRRIAYSWASDENSNTGFRFLDSHFLVDNDISAIWRRFFCRLLHWICWMSAIFLLPVWLTYWSRKWVTCFSLKLKISTKFEVDTTFRCLVIALVMLICYVTFWPWPFDLGQWSYMAGHMINFFTKLEDPTAIRFSVMGSDISQRIPLTMRLQPMRMRRITWPMCRGKFFPHISNSWPRFVYLLCIFCGDMMMLFKGRLQEHEQC